jgi:hypothetical protein
MSSSAQVGNSDLEILKHMQESLEKIKPYACQRKNFKDFAECTQQGIVDMKTNPVDFITRNDRAIRVILLAYQLLPQFVCRH